MPDCVPADLPSAGQSTGLTTRALDESDVRAMVRLMGDVCALTAGLNEKKRALMTGLCSLIGADYWTWGLAVRLTPDSLPTWVVQLHGGFTDAQMTKFLAAQEHPDMTALTAPFAALLQERGTHLTRLRQQTDPRNRFVDSGAYELWEAAGVAPGILSCRPIPSGTVSGISIHRTFDAPYFSERESRIAHIVLTEVPWLYVQPEDAGRISDQISGLSPRCHTVFNLLVLGQSRQQIAENLAISIHTTNGYVKDVFRHFGVQSQIELMRRFSQGNGGDV